MKEKAFKLPSLKLEHKLPVVLNYQESMALFNAPQLLKHRVLLALIYSAGLRAQEASRLKIADIDSGRMMIHIRQSKYHKDRYVPLSPMILRGLRTYYYACKPVEYLFNGNTPGSPLSVRGIQWVLRESVRKCKLHKRITLHTLRHSYATHLLEFGMDILSIKELLGHARINTTMIYLHVAKPRRTNLFSPLDCLYNRD
jgi:integrase/recombinase XerD